MSLTCMFVYALRTCQRVEYPGTGVTEGWKPPRGCWESSPSSLQEQPELLNPESSSALTMQLLSLNPNGSIPVAPLSTVFTE